MTSTPQLFSEGTGAVVLSFQEVTVGHANESNTAAPAVIPFSFQLREGELAVFESSIGGVLPDIAGLASGLIEPVSGEIRFCDVPWTSLDQIAAAEQRVNIGQVFQSIHRAHWITNLDIDENVYLAEQMAGNRSQADLETRANKLAEEFGLKGIPNVRESLVPRQPLMIAQWIRAFLPTPLKLLILERAFFGVDVNAIGLLFKKIEDVRSKGTAVLWVGPPLSHADNDALKPSQHFRATEVPLLAALS